MTEFFVEFVPASRLCRSIAGRAWALVEAPVARPAVRILWAVAARGRTSALISAGPVSRKCLAASSSHQLPGARGAPRAVPVGRHEDHVASGVVDSTTRKKVTPGHGYSCGWIYLHAESDPL